MDYSTSNHQDVKIATFFGKYLLFVLCDADDHQQAEAVIHADIAVDAIRPQVHIPLLAEITLTPVAVFINPVLLQPAAACSACGSSNA